MNSKLALTLRIALYIIAATTAAVVVIFLIDRSTVVRFYDLIILLLGTGALILGITASMDSRAQRQASEKIQKEISEAIKELRKIDRENDHILEEIEEAEMLDRKLTQELLKKK